MIVVTQIQARGGAQPTQAPIHHSVYGDDCVFYTVSAVSFTLGLTRVHVRKLIERHRQHLDGLQSQDWSDGRWPRNLIWSVDLEKLKALRRKSRQA